MDSNTLSDCCDCCESSCLQDKYPHRLLSPTRIHPLGHWEYDKQHIKTWRKKDCQLTSQWSWLTYDWHMIDIWFIWLTNDFNSSAQLLLIWTNVEVRLGFNRKVHPTTLAVTFLNAKEALWIALTLELESFNNSVISNSLQTVFNLCQSLGQKNLQLQDIAI